MRPAGRILSGVTAVTLIATAFAWIAGFHLQPWFARYFGLLPPALCVAVLGGIALLIAPMLRHYDFWGSPRAAAVRVVALFILGFAAVIFCADLLIGFPAGINAPLPWALLYYPAMGFAAQVALHLLPLAAILWMAPNFARRRPWMAAGISSFPEAILQATSSEGIASGFVALHLIGFGMAEIYLLRRYGFLVMYGFRLGYYLLWHIAWGTLRAGLH